jgi:hypothetical protein
MEMLPVAFFVFAVCGARVSGSSKPTSIDFATPYETTHRRGFGRSGQSYQFGMT